MFITIGVNMNKETEYINIQEKRSLLNRFKEVNFVFGKKKPCNQFVKFIFGGRGKSKVKSMILGLDRIFSCPIQSLTKNTHWQ